MKCRKEKKGREEGMKKVRQEGKEKEGREGQKEKGKERKGRERKGKEGRKTTLESADQSSIVIVTNFLPMNYMALYPYG